MSVRYRSVDVLSLNYLMQICVILTELENWYSFECQNLTTNCFSIENCIKAPQSNVLAWLIHFLFKKHAYNNNNKRKKFASNIVEGKKCIQVKYLSQESAKFQIKCMSRNILSSTIGVKSQNRTNFAIFLLSVNFVAKFRWSVKHV